MLSLPKHLGRGPAPSPAPPVLLGGPPHPRTLFASGAPLRPFEPPLSADILSRCPPKSPSPFGRSPQNIYDVLALKVSRAQDRFVASNAKSIAEAYVHQAAWPRAVYAGENPVGFVMLHDENLTDEPEIKHFYSLWRLMIDAEHQGKGYGPRAVELVIEHVKSNPDATELLVSFIPGDGSPEAFYTKLGFRHTGQFVNDTEPGMRLELTR